MTRAASAEAIHQLKLDGRSDLADELEQEIYYYHQQIWERNRLQKRVIKLEQSESKEQSGTIEDGWSEMKQAIWQRGYNVGWNAVLEEAATITQGHGSLQEKVDRIRSLKRNTTP